jgi:hypothetical protein
MSDGCEDERKDETYSTSSSGGGACGVHVVHTVLADQGEQGLGGFLDSLVESFRGGVTVLSQNLVLRSEHALDTAHKDTSLSVQVRVDFLFKRRFVTVTGTDGDTECDGLLLGVTGNVLVDGDGRVDTSTFQEQGSDSSTGTLGGDQDDVDVLGRDNTSVLLVDDGETVGKVQGLALGDQGSELRPCLGLSGVGKQVHDDGTLVDGLFDTEQGLSGNPTVFLGLLPGFTAFTDTDNDLEAVVSGVEGLTVTLGTVTDHGQGVVLEVAAKSAR